MCHTRVGLGLKGKKKKKKRIINKVGRIYIMIHMINEDIYIYMYRGCG